MSEVESTSANEGQSIIGPLILSVTRGKRSCDSPKRMCSSEDGVLKKLSDISAGDSYWSMVNTGW